jgi:hypothetical protein
MGMRNFSKNANAVSGQEIYLNEKVIVIFPLLLGLRI